MNACFLRIGSAQGSHAGDDGRSWRFNYYFSAGWVLDENLGSSWRYRNRVSL